MSDLRHAVRALRKNPAFSLFVIAVLALGIGATTTVFTFADAILFKPLEYPDADRIVKVWREFEGHAIQGVTPAEFLEWKEKNPVFSDMAGWTHGAADFNLTGHGPAERLRGIYVTQNYFAFLGARTVAGRTFVPEEAVMGRERVTVISHRFCRRRFASEQDALGRTMILNQKPHVVVGVLGPDGPLARTSTDVYFPLVIGPSVEKPRFSSIYARLKPDVTIDQAIAALTPFLPPSSNPPLHIRIRPFRDEAIHSSFRTTAWILLGAVALLLLTACANVANLLLARAAARKHEAAVRLSLGATRSRLMRLFLVESLTLSILGSAAGMLLAQSLVALLPSIAPAYAIPREVALAVDWRVLAFSVMIALLSGAAFGLAPALHLSAVQPHGSLKEGMVRKRERFRAVLLVAEVALTFVLVTGSALLLRTFYNLTTIETGFRREGLVTFKTQLDEGRYKSLEQVAEFQRQLLDRLGTLPSVTSAGFTNAMPLGGSETNTSFFADGVNSRILLTKLRVVSDDYVRTMGTPLLRGSLTSQAGGPSILVNQSFVQQYLGSLEPIGRTMRSGTFNNIPASIGGVVGDVRAYRLEEATGPEVYVLASTMPLTATKYVSRELHFVARTTIDPATLIPAVRAALAAVDKDQPLYDVRTMEQAVSSAAATPRFRALLFSWFGALALLIAATGIFAVLHSLVSQRTHEIGVRMAVGASPGNLVRWVVRQGLTSVLAGIAIGIAGSLASTRVLATYLFGVTPHDPVAFAGTAAVLLIAALAACWIPARRATRVDPMAALRTE